MINERLTGICLYRRAVKIRHSEHGIDHGIEKAHVLMHYYYSFPLHLASFHDYQDVEIRQNHDQKLSFFKQYLEWMVLVGVFAMIERVHRGTEAL